MPDRTGARVAYAAAAVNLGAALVMVGVLRPGVPAGEDSLDARIDYVARNATAWRASWFVWNLAAIALIAFYVVLARRWWTRAPVACGTAVALAAAGLAADVGAEAMLMIVSPGADAGRFAVVEDVAMALTGYLGNGLYTVAGALLTAAGRRELPRALVGLGAAAWAAGLALSGATLARSPAWQFAATAILMPLFVAWTILVGRWMSRAS